MEWNSADDINQDVVATMNAALQLIYFSCGIELQTEAAARLGTLHDQLADLRADYISVNDEPNANAAMRAQLLASGIKNLLEMWVLLKQENASEAWQRLVEAQEDLRIVQRIQPDNGVEGVVQRLLLVEELCFPPQLFFSPGFTFKTAFCSICQSTFGECEHIRGRIYMGQICRRIIPEYQIEEASLVTRPEDKRCRVEEAGIGTSRTCTLTLRPLPDTETTEPDQTTVQGTLIRFD